MSNLGEHLSWCLEKDQIEFDSPNEMLAEDYLNKARETLGVAKLLEENEYYDWSVTASYYARYFALTALLRKCGFKVDNHACAITLFEFAFIEPGEIEEEFLNSIKKGRNERVEKHYGIAKTTDTTSARQREKAIDFVTELTGYMESLSSGLVNKIRDKVKKV